MNIVGRRISLDEYECMAAISSELPLFGTVERNLTSPDFSGEWTLIRLEKTLKPDLSLKIGVFAGGHLIIRSKWQGYDVKDLWSNLELVGVHVLLVDSLDSLLGDSFLKRNVYHAAWADCRKAT